MNEVVEVVEDALIRAVELCPLQLLQFVIAGRGAGISLVDELLTRNCKNLSWSANAAGEMCHGAKRVPSNQSESPAAGAGFLGTLQLCQAPSTRFGRMVLGSAL
jgi:hypothetical protein